MSKFVFLIPDYSSSDSGEFTIINAESEKQAVFQMLEHCDGIQPNYVKTAILNTTSIEDSICLLNKFRGNGAEAVSMVINLDGSNIVACAEQKLDFIIGR